MSNGNYGSEEYRPLTAWQYFWLQVLYAIPFVGFIFFIKRHFRMSAKRYDHNSLHIVYHNKLYEVKRSA